MRILTAVTLLAIVGATIQVAARQPDNQYRPGPIRSAAQQTSFLVPAPEARQDDEGPDHTWARLTPEPDDEAPEYTWARLTPEPDDEAPEYTWARLTPEPDDEAPNIA